MHLRIVSTLRVFVLGLLLFLWIWLLLAGAPPPALAVAQWIQRTTPVAPSPRCEYGFAYDSDRGVAVLFGGSSNLTFAAVNRETWEWDGNSWTLQSSTGPAQRCDQAMAYDSNHHRVVLFGGYNGFYLNDTWEWDGVTKTWTQVVGPGPVARADAFMAFDSNRNVMVLFGGQNSSGGILGDTWEYNGTWTQRLGLGPPAPRWIQRMAFDRQRGVVVMYGGSLASGLLRDVWEWNGTTWTPRPNGPAPARYGNALCFDTDLRQTLMFGGQSAVAFGNNPLGDTWSYNGTAWSPLAIPGPSARTFVKMVYDQNRHRAVLFGGFASGAALSDTWELVTDVATPTLGSLALAEAAVDRVTLEWQFGPTVTGLHAQLSRKQEETDWAPIQTAVADVRGRVRFVDSTVRGGERYGYQLELRDADGEVWSDQTWVDVPRTLALAVHGFRPNPGDSGSPQIALTLPAAASARLEVLDVNGRRILDRNLTGLAPGTRSIGLGPEVRLAAGVYLLRLTQGRKTVTTKGVLAK